MIRKRIARPCARPWGGLVAASFLEGFGDAVSRAGTRSYASVYGSGLSVPNYSLGKEAWIAAGKVGERAAGVFEKNFTVAPTVTLNSGTLMGVLILQIPKDPALVRPGSAPQAVPIKPKGTFSALGNREAGNENGPRFVHIQP